MWHVRCGTSVEFGVSHRLVFPLEEGGPITITVTPCDFPLSWTLTLRPHHGRGEVESQPPREGGSKKIRAVLNSVGGRGAFHRHRHHQNTITNVSRNSSKLVGHERRKESSVFSVLQQVAANPYDTTASPGRKGEGTGRREVKKQQETMEIQEAVEEQYEGHEPQQFRRQQTPAGLYVLQVRFSKTPLSRSNC